MTPPAPPSRRTACAGTGDHIGLHDALQRGVHLLHAHLRFQDAGVVHQRGDRPRSRSVALNRARMPARSTIRAHGHGGPPPADRVDHRLRASARDLFTHTA